MAQSNLPEWQSSGASTPTGSSFAQAPADPPSAGGLGLGQVAAMLRRRWWMLLLGGGLAFGLAWLLVPQDQTVYRARAVVQLDDARRSLTGSLTAESDNVRSPEYMASQIELIHSRTLLGEVVDSTGARLVASPGIRAGYLSDVSVATGATADTLHLRFSPERFVVSTGSGSVDAAYGVPVDIDGIRFTLRGPPEVASGYLAILPSEVAINELLKGMSAAQRMSRGTGRNAVVGSSFIDVLYSDPDPNRAIRVVNAVANTFQVHNVASVQERSSRRSTFIAHLLERAEGDLEVARDALTRFRSESRLYSSRDLMNTQQSSLMSLDVRREELIAERRMAVTLLRRMERPAVLSDQEVRTLIAAPGINSSAIVSQVFSQLMGYQTERERMIAAGRAESHPDVERLNTLIASSKAAFVDAVRSHIGSLDLRVAALDDMRARSSSSIQELPHAEAEETTLQQNVDMAQRLVTTLRDEHQRARIAEAAEVGQVQVVDLARSATPVKSGDRLRNLGIALVFGLFLGAGGALVVEMRNSSIRRRDEMETLLHVPSLAVIPQIGAAPPARGRWSPATAFRRKEPLSAQAQAAQLMAATALESIGAEAYRQLRTNLFFSQPEAHLRTLVVCSATSGEGKTTTAANLAVTFARQGMRVLLVDCDLRRPRVHHVFQVERDPGFTDLLLGRATPAEAIRSTTIERLYVLPRGTFDVDAIEMLGSSRTREVFDGLAERFDAVLIDTSPVLVAADATVVGAMADGVLLVVRAGHTSRDDVRQALGQLATVGARVVGSVLNDPDSAVERYGDSYYRYYGDYAVTE